MKLEDLIFETKRSVYNFQQFKTIIFLLKIILMVKLP